MSEQTTTPAESETTDDATEATAEETTTETTETQESTWTDAAEKVLAKLIAPVRKAADNLRTLAGKERDERVAMGRGVAALMAALDPLKLDAKEVQARIVAECGIAPRTGEPFTWGYVKSCMDAAAVIDALPEEYRDQVGVDAALAFRRIATVSDDTDEMVEYAVERIESGESLAPKTLRTAVADHLIEEGWVEVVTPPAKVKKLVKRFTGEDTHKDVHRAIGQFTEQYPELIDAETGKRVPALNDLVEAVAYFALVVASGDKVNDVTLKATEQLLAKYAEKKGKQA